ncbi:MAG: hypothetical protein KGP35_09310 [Bacteroidetes bacterium]|nr:hypothetical protein [Bacteroidota bacterium]
MKYSTHIGILFCGILILTSFFPWIFIGSNQVTVSGVGSEIDIFGKPALMNFYLLPIIVLFFLIPKLWAKKLNPFVGAINFAWALRNFLLLSTCRYGECPQQQSALYFYFLSALVILVMTVLPYKTDN